MESFCGKSGATIRESLNPNSFFSPRALVAVCSSLERHKRAVVRAQPAKELFYKGDDLEQQRNRHDGDYVSYR